MSGLKNLSVSEIEKKIKGLEGLNEKFGGKNKKVADQLNLHKEELKSRASKEEKKEDKKIEEAVKKAESKKKSEEKAPAKKEEKKKEPKKETHKFFYREITQDGEILKDDVAEISGNDLPKSEALKEIKETLEKAKDDAENIIEVSEKAFTTDKKEKKPAAKKAPAKKAAPKKEEKKETYKLVIDGKEYVFHDEKDKNECEKALKAVKAKAKEEEEHKAAREKGREEAMKIPVTTRVTDSFASITKKIVAEAKKNDDKKSIDEVKKAVSEVEKAFGTLFDKLESLMGKKIPQAQRKSIMSILEGYEDSTEEERLKEEEKKAKAKSKRRVTKKEDGGFVETGGEDSWSYLSFLN